MSIVEIGVDGAGSTERAEGAAIDKLPLTPAKSAHATVPDDHLLAVHGRTFHFAWGFLPRRLRRDVVILYAFFRRLDDLVDEAPSVAARAETRVELDAWRMWLRGGRTGSAPREPLGAQLASMLDAHAVPASVLLDFLDGMTRDLEPAQMRNFAEMRRYCYEVAGTVGLAMTHMLGATSPQALAAAESLGTAMQLTNILRDVGGDLQAGRIYLPQDDLERFGSSPAHLLQLYEAGRGPDERFRALLRHQIARAHRFYADGMAGIWLLPRDCRLPILVAGRLYRAILAAIERNGYDVLRRRASTSTPQKVREAGVALALDRLWRRGEASGLFEGVALED